MRSPISFMEETMARTRQENKPEMEVQEENAVCEETVKEEKIEKVKEKKIFTDSDYILCRSVWFGGLNVTCKSGNSYEFSRYGAECEINYRDLVSLIRKGSDHIFLPRFIIEDEDLVEQWGSILKPIYDKINTQTIEDFFGLPLNKFKAQLKIMPEGLKDAIKTKAGQMIQDDELYDIRKVREIDAAWGTDFVEMFVK